MEEIHKIANQREIIEFFTMRLRSCFVAVSDPGLLSNTKGALLFALFFAAGNEKGAGPGLRIANSLVTKLNALMI